MTRKLSIVIALTVVIVVGVLVSFVRESDAIPAWARKYNADCSMCHFPTVPRLNSFGHQFRRAGYRTPDEFNKDQDVTKVGDFFAARLRTRFNYENKEGQIERSEFTLNDATFFYAGAVSRNFSGFVESEIESDGEIELVAQLQGVLGQSERYVSIRMGQMHPFQRVGFGGFDRPTGISTNPLHSTTLTRATGINGANFALNRDQKGVELAYVQGRARILGQVLNGMNTSGSGTGTKTDIDPQKDYLVAYEHILDDIASGFTVFYYNGTHHGTVDLSGNFSDRFDYSRFGVNANKVFPVGFGFFELQGGYIRSFDNVPANVGPDVQGNAFYVESQQYLKGPEITFLERFSLIDIDAARKNTTRKDCTAGVVVPVQTWLRVAAEYTYTDNRATGLSDHTAVAELMINW